MMLCAQAAVRSCVEPGNTGQPDHLAAWVGQELDVHSVPVGLAAVVRLGGTHRLARLWSQVGEQGDDLGDIALRNNDTDAERGCQAAKVPLQRRCTSSKSAWLPDGSIRQHDPTQSRWPSISSATKVRVTGDRSSAARQKKTRGSWHCREKGKYLPGFDQSIERRPADKLPVYAAVDSPPRSTAEAYAAHMAKFQEHRNAHTRRRIIAAACRLFAGRGGFDAVTLTEIAASAEVAIVTMLKHFATKELLVLQALGEDLADVIERRPAGQSPAKALRAHYRVFVAQPAERRKRVSTLDHTESTRAQRSAVMATALDSHAFSDAVNDLLHRQRRALTRVLVKDYGELTAALTAAQLTAVVLTLQEAFFASLAAGATLQEAGDRLAEDVEVAFDLLERGID